MSDLGRALVLAGGLSYEREVSLGSGRRVAEALAEAGVEVMVADVDAALLSELQAQPPDAVFVALHGAAGEDGAVRGVLELLDIPYVGSRVAACRLAFDKPTAKAAAAAAGLRTAESVALPSTIFRELGAAPLLERIVARFGLPLVVKPARGGSALGMSVVREASALPPAMVTAFAYGDVALIERFVAGVELAVGVVELDGIPRALPAVQVSPAEGVFDYAARYTAGASDYQVPAPLSDETAAAVAETALRAHQVLGLRDISRTDMILSEAGPVFLEVNVAPGMTATSLLPMAVAADGLDLGVLCRDLLVQAHRRGCV
ncbi:MAG: D-alanine--D-alanine ligase family protein [Mycobacteriales bacterium]